MIRDESPLAEVTLAAARDETLLEHLATVGLHLAPAVAVEIERRGARMVEPLARLARSTAVWRRREPERWAAGHAIVLLSAICGGGRLAALPQATRRKVSTAAVRGAVQAQEFLLVRMIVSSAHMLAFLGPEAADAIQELAVNKDECADYRDIAIAAHGLMARMYPDAAPGAIARLTAVARDNDSEWDVRSQAAEVLIRFAAPGMETELRAMAPRERAWAAKRRSRPNFDEEAIAVAYRLASPPPVYPVPFDPLAMYLAHMLLNLKSPGSADNDDNVSHPIWGRDESPYIDNLFPHHLPPPARDLCLEMMVEIREQRREDADVLSDRMDSDRRWPALAEIIMQRSPDADKILGASS